MFCNFIARNSSNKKTENIPSKKQKLMNGRKHLWIAVFLGVIVASCTPVSKKSLQTCTESKENMSVVADEPTTQQEEPSGRDDEEALNKGESVGGAAGESVGGYELPAFRQNSNEIILRRRGYTVSYNPTTKLPNWVAWHLTASHVEGSAKRKGIPFHEDEGVPEPRVDTYDYIRSGYDRGHMCPAADNKWDALAMEQSFLMTNICPQDHVLNIGDWNNLETQCRQWAEQYGGVYIVCGPILYKGKHKTIGKNKVVVPEAFFKVILRMGKTPQAIGFIYRNNDKRHPWGDYVNSVDEVERITGLDFFPTLPDDVEQKVERSYDAEAWPMQALH